MFETLVNVADSESLIAQRRCRIFDCSFDLADPAAGRAAFVAEHLPTARYLHLDEDLSAPAGPRGRHPLPDAGTLAAKLRDAGLEDGQQVIAYDNAGGPYAARLWWLLRWMGHRAVAVLDGGIQAWTAAGLPLERGDPGPASPGNFVASAPRSDLTVDAAAVLANLSAPEFLVVDARAGQRFRGEVLMMDAVAGHIPGARNRPFKDNLDAGGGFKPAATLAAEFDAVLDGQASAAVVLQCGSGVTACHNALALEVAGRPGARLYPGSWSEWVTDPTRPVALGA